MAIAPTIPVRQDKRKIFELIVRSMGYKSIPDMINHIYVSAGTPAGELSDMDDYCLVWDSTNNVPYVHTTGTTFTAIGQAITFNGGHPNNANTVPNAEG